MRTKLERGLARVGSLRTEADAWELLAKGSRCLVERSRWERRAVSLRKRADRLERRVRAEAAA